jgi:hypothetical protein
VPYTANIPEEKRRQIGFQGSLWAETKLDLAAYIAVMGIETYLLGFTQVQ